MQASGSRPHAVVVGAGVGGLVTGSRLAKAGLRVTVFEKNSKEEAGGRMSEHRWESGGASYRFETGPSLLLLPEVYRRAFDELGASLDDYVKVKKVEPSYRVWFDDGTCTDLYTDREKTRAVGVFVTLPVSDAIERLEKGAYDRYCEYLDSAQANLDFGLPAFIEERLELSGLPRFTANLIKAWPLQSHYGLLKQWFKTEKMRALLAFQDLYVGLSPYDAPAVFSLLQAIELNEGVYYPVGGFKKIARALVAQCEHLGATLHFGCQVDEILTNGEGAEGGGVRATGVTYRNLDASTPEPTTVPADLVVTNVDLPWAKKYLLPPTMASSTLHDKAQFSSSVVSLCWALDKRYEALQHHSVFLCDSNARQAWDNLMVHNTFDPKSFNFYVHAPSRTDPSVCPPGHDAIMVLVPCPVLSEKAEGEAALVKEASLVEQARQGVLERFTSTPGMEDFRSHILHERVFSPSQWRDQFSLSRGAVFGLRHGLNQLYLLRPAPQDPRIQGLYYVGASTRPGNGVPLVMIGARLLSERLIEKYGRKQAGS